MFLPLSIPFLSRVMRHFTTHPCGDGSKTKASKLSIISASVPIPRSSSSLYKNIDNFRKISKDVPFLIIEFNERCNSLQCIWINWKHIYLCSWIVSLCICFIPFSITICFFRSIYWKWQKRKVKKMRLKVNVRYKL